MFIKYIKSAKFDSFFFFSPLLFVIIFTFLINNYFSQYLIIQNDPLWLFLFIILFDVAHVWWTLFRVYFNKLELVKHKELYFFTPLITFLLAFFLMLFDRSWIILFSFIWLFAVYHFIKQQIWFILVYANKELNTNKIERNKYETFSIIKIFLKLWFFWFLFVLLSISIFEEYLWDQFFRYENFELWGQSLFNFLNELNIFFYSIIIWVLTIPQLTHYYLDWYIWKKGFWSRFINILQKILISLQNLEKR